MPPPHASQANRLAAAVPICGGAVPVARSRSAVEALEKAGGAPRYTEYEGIGHVAWGPAYNEPELPGWLFAQKRGGR
jgi:hypothetical protein